MKLRQKPTARTLITPALIVPALLILLVSAACSSGSYVAPPPQASTALPSGALLKPWAAGHQGLPKPEGATLTSDGRVWLTLSNLGADYAPAGPGMLASVTPSNGATTLVDLGGTDEHGCINPGVVKNDNGVLLVTCTGGFDPSNTQGRAVVAVDPANGTVVHTVAAPAGMQPATLAAASTKIWVGDSDGANLFSIDRQTFALTDGADAAHPAIALPCTDAADAYAFVGDLLVNGNELFALCSAEPDGYIVRLDATTGAVKGTAQLTGATPVAMALTGDGRIAIVNSVDETLALATITADGLTVQRAAYTFAQGAALQDVKARGEFLYTVSSGTNTVQKLDLTKSGANMLVDEESTGDNSAPWAIVPLDDSQVAVTSNALGTLLGLKFKAATAR